MAAARHGRADTVERDFLWSAQRARRRLSVAAVRAVDPGGADRPRGDRPRRADFGRACNLRRSHANRHQDRSRLRLAHAGRLDSGRNRRGISATRARSHRRTCLHSLTSIPASAFAPARPARRRERRGWSDRAHGGSLRARGALSGTAFSLPLRARTRLRRLAARVAGRGTAVSLPRLARFRGATIQWPVRRNGCCSASAALGIGGLMAELSFPWLTLLIVAPAIGAL